MARTAFDTGFLVKYLANQPEARKIFARASTEPEIPVLPAPVYFELETLTLRGKIRKEAWKKFKMALEELAEFCVLDKEACLEAAKLRHTYALSSVDVMIVSIALVNRCRILLTTDRTSLALRLKHAQIGIKVKVLD